MALKSSDVHPDVASQVTVQDYSAQRRIAGVEIVELRRFVDEGGSFLELGRLARGVLEDSPAKDFEVRQLSYSVMDPGAVKAFHLHYEQSEFWFVPPESKLLVGLYDVRATSETAKTAMRFTAGDGQARLVYIPAGVAHGAANLGRERAQIIYFTDRTFSPDPDQCDERRLPWDILGADFWSMAKG